MQSVMNEVAKLRMGAPIVIDYHNSNRYRLVVQESNGTKTAYCFSTPIYNRNTRKLVDMRFRQKEEVIYATGSSANITMRQGVHMENAEGSVSIELPQNPIQVSDREVRSGSLVITPTTNGIAVKCDVKNNLTNSFTIETGQPHLKIRANDRCFALMKEKFRPLAVLSCIGSLDLSGNTIAPAKVGYQNITDKKYEVTVSATSPLAHTVYFEINLYENKLFQDTTVESANPTTNNAFGGVGFIGNSSAYGEQWLYTRPDYSRISEIMDKRVHKVVLHMPKLNCSNVEMSAYKVVARFCSFGSNWDNKISGGSSVSDSKTVGGYQSLDITSLLVDPRTRTLSSSEGLILKSKIKDSGFSVISTGDSYFAPQILEINYR